MTSCRSVWLAGGMVAAVCSGVVAQPSITGVGTGGSMNWAFAVSADGRVVVGSDGSDPSLFGKPFVWTASSGEVLLDTVFGKSGAYAVSADGSVVVGQARGKPFRWTLLGGLQNLSVSNGNALAVSADGSIVVGYLGNDPSTSTAAFKWTQATGLQTISLPGYLGNPAATAISGDGTVIAINGVFPGTGSVRVTSGGITDVPRLPGGNHLVYATGLNFDGTVMVGYQENGGAAGNQMAYRWQIGQNPINIGVPSGTNEAVPQGVSADGSTIVGYGDQHHTTLGPTPFVWKQFGGMSTLSAHLANAGVSIPSGSTPRICYGVSGNGLVIVGSGTIPGFTPGSFRSETVCYANCDGSTAAPVLTANDFQCFLNKWAAGDSYANCDGNCNPICLTANDFQCFLNFYAFGCP